MADFVTPGSHLLLDFWGAKNIQNKEVIEKAMREAAKACNAKVLGVTLHEFGEGAGITGVAVLAESHISIHTWPEISYVALDVFMCGKCDPQNAIPVFEKYFEPTKSSFSLHKRGAS